MNWLSALHIGEVFGTAYRIVLSLLGLVVAGLSGTGVVIWWRKLRSRHAMHRRKEAQSKLGKLDLAQQSAAVRSLAALFCLVLLAGALTGAVHHIF